MFGERQEGLLITYKLKESTLQVARREGENGTFLQRHDRAFAVLKQTKAMDFRFISGTLQRNLVLTAHEA